MKQHLVSTSPVIQTQDLTQSQLLMWAGQTLSPTAPLYNMVLAFKIKGSLDVAKFQLAFQALVNSSDSMRIIFQDEAGIPKQSLLSQMDYQLPFMDWSEHADPKAKYEEWAPKRSQIQLDLSRCGFDSSLIKINQEQYIWYFNQHHLITDAWSVSILYRKMVELYQAAVKEELTLISAIPNFSAYLKEEKQRRESEKHLPIRKFWEEKVRSLPSPPRLYGYRAGKSTSRSQRVFLDLGKERSNQLRQLAQEADVRSWTPHLSLFNIFATSLFAFLYKVGGQEQVSFGTPAHNRPTPLWKETAGVFIEIFPMAAELSTGDSLGSLLQRVKAESNSFLRYAQTGAASPALSKGFNVILNYIHAAFSDFAGMPMESDWVHPQHCDPRHHLRLQVHDMDASGSIQLHFDLNEAVFNEQQRQVIPQHFLAVLDAFIEDRSQTIDAIPIITATEISAKRESQNTAYAYKSTYPNVVEALAAQVMAIPDHVAIQCHDQQHSYKEFERRSNQLAHHLIQLGVKPGQRIAVHLHRSTELLLSIWAVLKTGACYLPISPDYPKQRITYMLEDADVAFLIANEGSIELDLGQATFIAIETAQLQSAKQTDNRPAVKIKGEDLAYIMYTSGSTGRPKGVMISHMALVQYLHWAKAQYLDDQPAKVALFSSIAFDLTVTSLFLPLIAGGTSYVYPESTNGPDLAILDVIHDNKVDFIKLTPSHLALLSNDDLKGSKIRQMIVGGEDFKTELASRIQAAVGPQLRIYNEYGPTEATVGCIVHQYNAEEDQGQSVPIGKASPNMDFYLLDTTGQMVPQGVVGELYLVGQGLAQAYWQRVNLTAERFPLNPFMDQGRMYKTGDLARINQRGQVEYLGRIDDQVKLDGRRIELGEVESVIDSFPGIQQSVVTLNVKTEDKVAEICNCTNCGLPSNYPNVTFDDRGICQLCNSFENYQQKVQQYFRTEKDLRDLFAATEVSSGTYDCIMLLSGGKDSTYALAQLAEMGLKVLAFTLDNGYISEQAKANIRRVVKALGVDHIFGSTPAMDAIFVDSLQRYNNVCDGCFKTIYTLSIKLALEKKIPYIVTGLSRGQFFETRLTEELFLADDWDIEAIDQTILEARKAYHRVDDAIKKHLDVSMFQEDEVFEKVRFVDFYRYTDVSLASMYDYLDQRLPWVRPTDTGRSTNCLINQAGIYVHKKEKGFSNYAFPYSWDVRIGHKTREASLDEINEVIDEKTVLEILNEIGYASPQSDRQFSQQQFIAYYTTKETIDIEDLRGHLAEHLPSYMIPGHFIQLDTIPLSPNGKVDRKALPQPSQQDTTTQKEFAAPSGEIEEILATFWTEVLHLSEISANDSFIELGGNSLVAIRLMARINETFELGLPVNVIFEQPTVSSMATYIENRITELLETMD